MKLKVLKILQIFQVKSSLLPSSLELLRLHSRFVYSLQFNTTKLVNVIKTQQMLQKIKIIVNLEAIIIW